MRRIVAGCGEEDEPEGVEGADMEGKEGVGEEGGEDVSGPDAAEGEFAGGAAFREGSKGRGRVDGGGRCAVFEVVGFGTGAVGVGGGVDV